MSHLSMETLLLQSNPVSGGGLRSMVEYSYAQARQRGRRGQFWSRLTGRSQSLYALKQVRDCCPIQAKIETGPHSVPIPQIRGSEGRSRYFDRDFHPLYDQTRGRWLAIARAMQQGKGLPLVSLVRVGDFYFVKDGHHRISVALALGQCDIEARVTVWLVRGRLPWHVFKGERAPNRALKGLKRRADLTLQVFLDAAKAV